LSKELGVKRACTVMVVAMEEAVVTAGCVGCAFLLAGPASLRPERSFSKI
jgi:hypothetical protein